MIVKVFFQQCSNFLLKCIWNILSIVVYSYNFTKNCSLKCDLIL